MIDLTHAFPHTAELDVRGHKTLQDTDFDPGCGYVSIEEAQILHACAQQHREIWCEIGAHTGWSSSYIAGAMCTVYALEPQFSRSDFLRRATENWVRAGVFDYIRAVPASSFDYLTRPNIGPFDGAFIDGNHDPGFPLQDAQLLMRHMQQRCAIVFHDNVGDPVTEAVAWVAEQGFEVRVFETMARLTVCTRE